MIRTLAILVALWSTQAAAYLGSFDPQPLRNEVTITFIDSQLPGPQCIAEQPAITAPLVLTAIGCAIYSKGLVIVPISPGIGWINAAQIFATPDALLGHETRHLFDGDFHPTVLPWLERVRSPDKAAGSVVSGPERGGDVPAPQGGGPERGDQRSRVHAEEHTADAGLTRCTFFTKARDVSYEALGALVRECVK